jgi:Flp pilus assembly protein TadD
MTQTRAWVGTMGLLVALAALGGCDRARPVADTASQTPEAAAALAKARRSALWRPRNPEVQLALGKAAYDASLYNDAYAAYRRAVTLAPSNPKAALGMAEVSAKLHNPGEALEWIGRVRVLQPGNTEVLQLEGRMLLLAGRFEEATAALQRAVAAQPDSGANWLNLASAYAVRGRDLEAVAAARRAVARRPDEPVAHLALAGHLQRIRQLPEAEREYRTVLRLDHANAAAMTSLAQLLLDQKRNLEEARLLATKACDSDAERPRAAVIAAWIMHLQGKTARGAEELRKLINSNPHNPEAWTKLAIMLRALGDDQKADEVERKGKAFVPPTGQMRGYADDRNGAPVPAHD